MTTLAGAGVAQPGQRSPRDEALAFLAEEGVALDELRFLLAYYAQRSRESI